MRRVKSDSELAEVPNPGSGGGSGMETGVRSTTESTAGEATESTARPARAHHGNRHGRSERARQAVLNAADDLLTERGFAGVTIEGIAAKAGVAKQTIYRWWPSKTEILMDAYLEDAAEDLVPADHGDLERDLRSYLHRLTRFLVETDPGEVFRALIGQSLHNPDVATVFRSRCVDAQRDRDRLLLARAVERGDLPSDLDVDTEVDRLVGPIYYRVLVTGQAVDPDFVDALVDGFLRDAGRRNRTE
jgi:AcrR family transcriptional regulator